MIETLTHMGDKTFPRRFYLYLVVYLSLWWVLVATTAVLFPLLQGSSFLLGGLWVMGMMLAWDLWRYAKRVGHER